MKIGIVGGGIIGLAIARECVQRGHDVTVYDPSPGRAASHVAAGMLAPVSEAYFGEEALTRLLIACAERWRTYDLGVDVGYRDAGTLQVGLTADDMAELTRLWRHQAGLGAVVREIDPRTYEPLLHPRAKGVLVPEDHQVDPRRVVAALLATVHIEPHTVAAAASEAAAHGPEAAGQPARHVATPPSAAAHGLEAAARHAAAAASEAAGAHGLEVAVRHARRVAGAVEADAVVIATGASVPGLPVRPVKGVLLRLRGPIALSHTIRGYAHGRSVYIVPRADGEIVIGATVEEKSDFVPQAGAVRDLLRAATDLVPDLAECELAEVNVGHRPATPDNGPIVGHLCDNVYVAAGHYRHGVLAAPLTADFVSDLIEGAKVPDLWKPFSPGRFK